MMGILPITFKFDEEETVKYYSEEFVRLSKLTKSKNLCELFKNIAETIYDDYSYNHGKVTK